MISEIKELLFLMIPAGTQVIIYFQSYSGLVLDRIFQFITLFGDKEIIFLLFLTLYLAVNKKWGKAIANILLISLYVNLFLKDLFAIPRPDDPQINILHNETTFSFPSGHSQLGLTAYGFLGLKLNRWLCWIFLIILIFLIGISRVYLGAHYPQDLLGGWLMGIVILILGEGISSFRTSDNSFWKPVISMAISFLLLISHFNQNTAIVIGIFMGITLGFYLEEILLRFKTSGSLVMKIVRVIIAFIITLPFMYLLENFLSEQIWVNFICYFLIGLFTSFIIPFILIRLRIIPTREDLSLRQSYY